MQLIPVLDLLDERVVQGKAGERERYLPVISRLTKSTRPRDVMEAMVATTRAEVCYVADLNGLMQGNAQTTLLKELTDLANSVMIDIGVRNASSLSQLPQGDHVQAVIASESLVSLAALTEITEQRSPESLVFSFDFMAGNLQHNIVEWHSADYFAIAQRLWECGIRQWIVLDISAVGMQAGCPTRLLCQQLRNRFPEAKLFTGGGVRTQSDLAELSADRIDGVLVSTALHNGSLDQVEGGRPGSVSSTEN